MSEVSDRRSRTLRLAIVAAISLGAILLLLTIVYLVPRYARPWRSIRNDETTRRVRLRENQEAAAQLSDEAILRRLKEIREVYIGAADKSMAESEHYYELMALSDELLRRIRSGADSRDRSLELFAEATELKIEKKRALPIVPGENCPVNTVVWMYPPLPLDISNEDGIAMVELSATLNGQPVENIASLSERRHYLVSWFKFQIRSDQFKPGTNTLSVQAHVRLLIPGKDGRSLVRAMEWDTPIVTETIQAERRQTGDLVRQVSQPKDVACMKRQARVRMSILAADDRVIDLECDFPALSVPICAIASIRASDGSWSSEGQVLVVPVGVKSRETLMAQFGENVQAPFEDNLRVDVEIRPDLQQAIWEEMPEIAGFCVKWEKLRLSPDDASSGVPPTRVQSTCSE